MRERNNKIKNLHNVIKIIQDQEIDRKNEKEVIRKAIEDRYKMKCRVMKNER